LNNAAAIRGNVSSGNRKLDMLGGGKRRDIWDYQWMFAGWGQHGVSAVANVT